jgi:phospholipase/carboxylesterase
MNFVLEHIHRPSVLNENAPLIIMCHGYGSDENDLFSFASELPEEYFVISLKAPYSLQPFGNAWYAINFDADQGKWSNNEQARSSRDLIAQFIEQACDFYSVDPTNVTLIGFSQGTILSLAVALSYPHLIKNVIGLSGYVNLEILKDDYRSKDFSHLQIFCSHGSADQVIPVQWARQTPPFLEALQISHIYKEYPVGHGVAPQNFYDFKQWLVSKP